MGKPNSAGSTEGKKELHFKFKGEYEVYLQFRFQLACKSAKIQGTFIQSRTMIIRHILLLENILKRSLVTKINKITV